MSSAVEQNHEHPRRLFLISVPRTASNLLVKVLNIHHQPDVLTNDKAGYYFYPVYLTAVSKGYFSRPIHEWTQDEKAEIRDLYQQCLDRLEAASLEAQRDGKMMFTKEHSFWLVNLGTMMLDAMGDGGGTETAQQKPHDYQKDADFFRLSYPEQRYGPQHDHTYSANNKTIFPDAYLRTWHFVFLIRHPALAWPSMYRAMSKLARLPVNVLGTDPDSQDDGVQGALMTNMTWKWSRYLVDWCAEHQPPSQQPLVLDAHDVIHNPDVVLKFCELAGLDRDAVQFSWEDGHQLDLGSEKSKLGGDGGMNFDLQAADIMTSTLRTSKGVIKEKTPASVDVDAEVVKWKEEFGVEVAALLERLVRDAMPDYEYLRERRVMA